MDVLIDELFEINFADSISIICVSLKITLINVAPCPHLQQCFIDLFNFQVLFLCLSLRVLSCNQLCLLHYFLTSFLFIFQ